MDHRRSSYKAKFRHQVAAGRNALLVLTGLTLINLVLLICKANYHFLISAAVPYYLNWICVKLGAAWIWRVLAALLAIGLVGFYGFCWLQSHRRRIFLTAALGAYGLDTLLLLIFAFTLVEKPASCVLEILTHLAVLGLLVVADQAAGAMQRIRSRAKAMEPV